MNDAILNNKQLERLWRVRPRRSVGDGRWFCRRYGSRVSIHNPVRPRVLPAPSLSRNPMPPRTTRKSDRRKVSDRTMVGPAQPLCLLVSGPNGVVTAAR